MFVTAHAMNRLSERMPGRDALVATRLLESITGEQGTVAYIIGALREKASAPDGSNGNLIVAVALDGSVETVYFRRSTQDIPVSFATGPLTIRDMRITPLYSEVQHARH